MKPSRRSTPKSRAAEEEMNRRVRAIAERNGRAPSPVHRRFDPSLIRSRRPAPPPKEKPAMPATVTDTDRSRVLACVEHMQPVKPAMIADELGLDREVAKLALAQLLADGQVTAEGHTRARVYSLPATKLHKAGDPVPPLPESAYPPGAQPLDPPPLADTPDLDDPDDLAAPVIPAKASITMTFPEVTFGGQRRTPLQRYADALLDRLTDAEIGHDVPEHIYDRIERCIALDLATRDDAEQLVERARALGSLA